MEWTPEKNSELYHVTSIENLDAINREGIQPSSSHRNSLEADLTELAAEAGIELPFDRRDCVFLYPSLSLATEFLRTSNDDPSPFDHQQGVGVVDGKALQEPLYVGEFQLIGDAIDFQYMDEPDSAMISNSYEEALHQYATSLERLDSFESLDSIARQFQRPEVIVQGGLHADAILEWLFLKAIRTDRQAAS